MRRFFVPTLILGALAGPSLAGDLPSAKPAPAAPEPVFTWTGAYLGFEGGVDWLSTTAYKPTGTYTFNRDPALAGAVAGYNLALPNNLLVGIESDGGAVLGAHQAKPFGVADSSYYANIRGRVGYIAAPDVLVFAAGGVAFGDVSNATAGSDRVGYTVGAGVEWAFVREFIARAEYRYTDLGKATGPLTVPVAQTSNALLLGLVYKFGPELLSFAGK